MANIRRSNGSKRDALKKRVGFERLPCHLCGHRIDYDAHYLSKVAYELDEIVPISRGGSPTDPDNVAQAHRCCNQWRGDRPLTAQLKAEIRARFEREVLGVVREQQLQPEYQTSRAWLTPGGSG